VYLDISKEMGAS